MTNFGSKVPTPKSLMGKCATGVRGGRGTIILKNNIMTTEQTKIEWENSKDELYTYFGKCTCGNTTVVNGSKYCSECGKLIINPLDM